MSLIESFFTNTYTVTRSQGGSYVDGFWVESSSTTLTVRGSMQPLNPREIKLLEAEGERLSQAWKFYSDQPLLPINTGTLAAADDVVINGEAYKVISSEIWQGSRVDLPHYKTILKRKPQQ